MTKLIVFDLDGVLANNDARARYLDQSPPDWDSFYLDREVAADVPVMPMIATYRMFCANPNFRVEIWSGRDVKTLLISRKWLMKHAKVLPAEFRFRPKDNRMTNLDLKRMFLQKSSQKPVLVFDGQPNTSEFWHKRGIQVCYCVHP